MSVTAEPLAALLSTLLERRHPQVVQSPVGQRYVWRRGELWVRPGSDGPLYTLIALPPEVGDLPESPVVVPTGSLLTAPRGVKTGDPQFDAQCVVQGDALTIAVGFTGPVRRAMEGLVVTGARIAPHQIWWSHDALGAFSSLDALETALTLARRVGDRSWQWSRPRRPRDVVMALLQEESLGARQQLRQVLTEHMEAVDGEAVWSKEAFRDQAHVANAMAVIRSHSRSADVTHEAWQWLAGEVDRDHLARLVHADLEPAAVGPILDRGSDSEVRALCQAVLRQPPAFVDRFIGAVVQSQAQRHARIEVLTRHGLGREVRAVVAARPLRADWPWLLQTWTRYPSDPTLAQALARTAVPNDIDDEQLAAIARLVQTHDALRDREQNYLWDILSRRAAPALMASVIEHGPLWCRQRYAADELRTDRWDDATQEVMATLSPSVAFTLALLAIPRAQPYPRLVDLLTSYTPQPRLLDTEAELIVALLAGTLTRGRSRRVDGVAEVLWDKLMRFGPHDVVETLPQRLGPQIREAAEVLLPKAIDSASSALIPVVAEAINGTLQAVDLRLSKVAQFVVEHLATAPAEELWQRRLVAGVCRNLESVGPGVTWGLLGLLERVGTLEAAAFIDNATGGFLADGDLKAEGKRVIAAIQERHGGAAGRLSTVPDGGGVSIADDSASGRLSE